MAKGEILMFFPFLIKKDMTEQENEIKTSHNNKKTQINWLVLITEANRRASPGTYLVLQGQRKKFNQVQKFSKTKKIIPSETIK